ncbi:hypothetical protein ABWJ92_38055 [Streptomyces sp. NPDC000609]|uniref:hypothetical protein n=1 Tax=Streptomyces sp. NPDC000609 TaxID=3160957 RepID=UPI0033992054
MRLVLIDEIHRLNPRTTTGAETTYLLKVLTARIGATFVYAGTDVTTTALFTGVRGAQLAARASLVECGAFPARLGTREPFRELIAGVEAALDLHTHRAGTLPHHTAYLHQRTAGRIGSPARLIRQAATTAILDRTERITKQNLDQAAWTTSLKPTTVPPRHQPVPAHDGPAPSTTLTRQNSPAIENIVSAIRHRSYSGSRWCRSDGSQRSRPEPAGPAGTRKKPA